MTPLQEMDALSLFDGMSCLQISMRELGITPRQYYASEINRYAIQNTQHNFPATSQLGDVTKWREWDIDWSHISFIGAGSPCQGFSLAGKQRAFNDPRSALFWVFIDILNHVRRANPNVKFLLENVVMKREHLQVISGALNLQPVLIDSALVSAQHRERYYWSNIRTKFGGLQTDIPQPEDRGIFLKDILNTDVPDKYYLSEARIAKLIEHAKRNTGNGNGFAARNPCGEEKGNSVIVGGTCQNDLIYQPARGYNDGGLFDKAPTLTTSSYTENNFVIQLNGAEEFGTQPRSQNSTYSANGKCPTLHLVGGGDQIIKVQDLVGKIRRLMPDEYARLQTIPVSYEWVISDTQIMNCCGNGWTIEVIKHILQHLRP
jgi:DNA (cytosine-5)-methyltransferase 3A